MRSILFLVLAAVGCTSTSSRAVDGGTSSVLEAPVVDPPLTCLGILECVGGCPSNEPNCASGCLDKGSTEGQGLLVALLQCDQDNMCPDGACLQTKCGAEVASCVSQASAASSTSGGAAAAGAAPVGSLPSSVVGTWTWVSSNGAISYTFNPDGTYTQSFLYENSYLCDNRIFSMRSGTAVGDATSLTLVDQSRSQNTITCGGPEKSTELGLEERKFDYGFDSEGQLLLRSGNDAATAYKKE